MMQEALNKAQRKCRSAFTLIEIMVAAAITIIMVGLVIQITGEVLKVWNRSVGKLSTTAEARMAMELLTADLETALFVNKDQQWLRVEWDETASQVGTPEVGQTVGLKLFSPAMDRTSGGLGNVCGIAYRLAKAVPYNSPSPDSEVEETYILFRSLEEPQNTFDNLLGSGDSGPQITLGDENGNLPNFWTTDNIVSPGNYLAGNIVDFKIYIIGIDPATGEEIVLNSSGDVNGFAAFDNTYEGSIDNNYMYGGSDGLTGVSPIFAEVALKVISDEGLEILELFSGPQLGAGTGYANVDEVLRAHAEVFKRRVYFQAGPL